MIDKLTVFSNHSDEDDNPTGGTCAGRGLQIHWQDEPLGHGKDRKEPTGAFVETVIQAAKQRLEFYQKSKFACDENQKAIWYLLSALRILESRTEQREARGVEGTHGV